MLLQIGLGFQRAPEEIAGYAGWLAANEQYKPQLGAFLGEAVEWSTKNPKIFAEMVANLDVALSWLNEDEALDEAQEAMFPNVAVYRRNREDTRLPLIIDKEATHNPDDVVAAAESFGQKLRQGETTKGDDSYSYHTWIGSVEGMVAATLIDGYQEYARTLGLYPEGVDIPPSVLANAITEALYICSKISEDRLPLFEILREPERTWIYGYPGFSKSLREELYGEDHEA